jgi:6-phosphogluconate dehydrogenase
MEDDGFGPARREEAMRFGVVGLGRMGANIGRHAVEKGHQVVGYDPGEGARKAVTADGVEPVASLRDLVAKLDGPRVVFLYVPHGEITDRVVSEVGGLLDRGDILVDGGNSHWEDSRRRYGQLSARGIRFVDMGTSGGIEGARTGACFMVGGPRDAYEVIEPLLVDLAADEDAVVHAGEQGGAGHFVKLIHNAIEFGMIQSIAEGVEMLRRSEYDLDLPSLFVNWNHGSVIRSWLIELMGNALSGTDQAAWDELSTYVEDTDEVKWVLNWALDADIPSPVIAHAQQQLMQYRDLDWPAAKAVALLRNQFGGHPVHTIGDTSRRA